MTGAAIGQHHSRRQARSSLRLRGIVKELEDEFFAPLDPESRKTLHELLLRLAAYNDPRCAFDPNA